MIDRLHFISSETEEISHIASIEKALDAGCRWIQLRVKGQSEDEVFNLAQNAKQLCERYQAKLIINDYPNVAQRINADGLHLGLTDMTIREARNIVGNAMVIGGTANTHEDVLARIKEGANYVGLGPYRFTTTKANLSPVLGLQGYMTILNSLKDQGSSIPIIAIGGITSADVDELISNGIYGVAMSNGILQTKNPKKTVSQIHQILC